MAKVTAALIRWKSRRDAGGTYPVWIRISDSDSNRYVTTGIRTRPGDWNKRKQEVRSTDPLHEEKNAIIRRKVEEVERERLRLILEDEEPATADRIKKAVTKEDSPDFFAFAEAHIEDLQKLGKVGQYRRMKSTAEKLADFTGKPLRFERITPKLLTDFETDCLARLGNKRSTVATNLRALRAIVNRAVIHRVITADQNPFGPGGFKITRGEATERTKLSFPEITRIQNLQLEPDSLIWHVRNLFLFSFFVGGIRFGDVVQMTAGRIATGTGDAPDRLAFRAGKTGKLQSIKITPPARRILEEYITDESGRDDYIFPFLRGYDLSTPKKLHNAIASRNTICNRYLKQIAKAASIDKPITTHVARHSFADAARSAGWSIYDISKALQHSSIKQTETYLKAFDSDALDGRMDSLFGEVAK